MFQTAKFSKIADSAYHLTGRISPATLKAITTDRGNTLPEKYLWRKPARFSIYRKSGWVSVRWLPVNQTNAEECWTVVSQPEGKLTRTTTMNIEEACALINCHLFPRGN